MKSLHGTCFTSQKVLHAIDTSLYRKANINIPKANLQGSMSMVAILNMETRKLAVVALLVAVSLFAIQPSLVHAASQPGQVTITARGSATPAVNSLGTSSANIYLVGASSVSVLNGGDIQFTQLSGILQIGPVFYPVVGGQGQSNEATVLQLNLQVGGNNPGSLVLQGKTTVSGEGYAVLFVPQQSNFENQYSLWLYGILYVMPAPFS